MSKGGYHVLLIFIVPLSHLENEGKTITLEKSSTGQLIPSAKQIKQYPLVETITL